MKTINLLTEVATKDMADLLRDWIKSRWGALGIPDGDLQNFLGTLGMVLFWILLGAIVSFIAKKIVSSSKKFEGRQTKQGLTMGRLVGNLIRALFTFWIVIVILKEIGIDVLPVLAGAGVIAFAIGFGAQELIKDLIGGFFLIMEKTFSIGDTIEIGAHKGKVLDIGLRRTKIENWRGEIITINNGDIKTLINSSNHPSLAVIEFNVEFATDLSVFHTPEFNDFLSQFAENTEFVAEEPIFVGVQSLEGGNIKLRITIKTENRKHTTIERSFRLKLVEYCHNHNIELEIPTVIEVLK